MDSTSGAGSSVHIGIAGLGYWGPQVVRNLFGVPDCVVVAAFDPDETRAERISRQYPSLELKPAWRDLLLDAAIDALVLATPAASHYALAKEALHHGKHVLVEKPLALSFQEANQLAEMADHLDRTLMVGHTYVYSSAVRKMREILDRGDLGDLAYYDTVRANLGLFRSDTNVLYDLATHDFSILDYLVREKPSGVRCVGVRAVRGATESLAYVVLHYPSGLVGHVHVNWLSPVKIRRTIVGGSKQMLVWDDTMPVERLKLYDSGVVPSIQDDVNEWRMGYRTGDVWSPRLDDAEPLHQQCAHFVECIRKKIDPLTNGRSGARVVRLLEAAQASLQNGGTYVTLPDHVQEEGI